MATDHRRNAIAPHVRRLAAAGWYAPSIASAYGISTATVRAILNPLPPPWRLPRQARPARRVDPWRGDVWRFSDDAPDPDAPEALDLVEAAELATATAAVTIA